MNSETKTVSLDDMALYDPERIRQPLETFLSKKDPSLDDLEPFHMHYYGSEAVYEMANELELRPGQTILDLGAGFCATSCILAKEFQCHITAVELQKHQARVGKMLVDKMGLNNSVEVLTNDFFELKTEKKFDGVITLFAITHIPDKIALFTKVHQILKPKGTFYIQDFYRDRVPAPEEKKALREKVASTPPPTKEEFCQTLESAGFSEVSFTDTTQQWTEFVKKRAPISANGQSNTNLAAFYSTVRDLFVSGCLKGAIIKAVSL